MRSASHSPEEPDQPPDRIRVGAVMPPAAPLALSSSGPNAVRLALKAFCAELQEALGVEVVAVGFSDYRALLDAMSIGQADLGWLPPVIALRSSAQGSTLPVALPVRGGHAWFSSALFARAGSPMVSLHDLKAARAAWVDHQSASGYLVMRAWLRSQGVDLSRAFNEEYFLGSHAAVVDSVLNGTTDVGATYAHLDRDGISIEAAGWADNPVHVLALAGPIPSDVVAASIRLPAPMIRQFQAFLTGTLSARMKSACLELLDAEGFVAAESEHITPLVKLLNHLDDSARRWHSIPPARNDKR
jgi:phosphonate transport system substrate-binding protein